MRKKFLTVALAATMTVASVFSAFAETKDVTIDGGFSANTGEEKLSGDFDVTYTFHNKSNDTSQNWFNYIVEIHTVDNVGFNKDTNSDAPVYIDARADNFGWTANVKEENAGAAKIEWAPLPEDHTWDNYAADMGAGMDCTVNIVRKGNDFTIKMNQGGKYSFTGTATAAEFAGQDVVVYLTGEKCSLTNVKFTNNTGSTPEQDTQAPAGEGETTAAPAGNKDNVTPSKTGDTSAVAVVAIVALGAAVAVVASKKKVTE